MQGPGMAGRRPAGPRRHTRRASLLGPLLLLAVAVIYTRSLWPGLAWPLDAASRGPAGAVRWRAGPDVSELAQPAWLADAAAGTKYLQFLVCMGYCNQVGAARAEVAFVVAGWVHGGSGVADVDVDAAALPAWLTLARGGCRWSRSWMAWHWPTCST